MRACREALSRAFPAIHDEHGLPPSVRCPTSAAESWRRPRSW
ncbi:Hypothetical protein A7982_01447 [Minicystis rosea]|nr:Hypothetical protein A7982_01447 [Minicystis rosea]